MKPSSGLWAKSALSARSLFISIFCHSIFWKFGLLSMPGPRERKFVLGKLYFKLTWRKTLALMHVKKKKLKCFKALYSTGLFFFFLCSNLYNNEILCMVTYCYVFYYNIWKYGLMEWLFQSLKQIQMQMLNSKQKKMKGEETELLGLDLYIYINAKAVFFLLVPIGIPEYQASYYQRKLLMSSTTKTVCLLQSHGVLWGLFIILPFKL